MHNNPPPDTPGNTAFSGPLPALRYRDFRLLWMGQLVSDVGSQMQMVAMNWQVFVLTNSAFALGMISFTRFVPIVVFSLIGGVFADVHDRRRILLVTQTAMTVFAAILGFLSHTGSISVGIIYLLAGLNAATGAFDAPARQALPPNLVATEHLTNALSLNNILHKTASVAGPALAGFVIAWWGIAAVYWINAASFLTVLIALLLMKRPTQKRTGATHFTMSALGEGIRFVRHSHILWATTLLDFLGTFFSSATALLPIFARDILRVGPQGLGILYAAQSVGSVITGGRMSFTGNIRRKGPLILWALAIYGTATMLYGMSRWFLLSLFFLALVGAADTFSTILRSTLRQLITPDHLRGRMNAVNMVFARGGPQLGNLEAGIVAAWIGAPLSVITGGLATLITAAAVAWWMPQLTHYRE